MGFDFGALLLQDSSLCSMAILSGAILSSDAAKKIKTACPGSWVFFAALPLSTARDKVTMLHRLCLLQYASYLTWGVILTNCCPRGRGYGICVEKYCAWLGGICEHLCGRAQEFPRVNPPVLATVVYIENNTWSRGDMEFIFECSHRYRMSERSERVRYRMWTREEKFHISKRPCIILFII